MQRAKRRLTCSRASASSLSNVSTRLRRSSRTSSAGGDCVAVNFNSNRFADSSEAKLKLNSTKYNPRLASHLRSTKKSGKVVKSQRPTFGSLQNAIVLAPFYTLKRSFQTKLVDLYSMEKLKKLNNRIKMAKKQNMSFEYDVVEVKPSSKNKRNGKREAVNRRKKSTASKPKKKAQQGSSGKSQVYCQCDGSKSPSKPRNKLNQKNALQNLKRRMKCRVAPGGHKYAEPSSPGTHKPLTVYSPGQSGKRKKFEDRFLAAPLLKTDLTLKQSKSSGNLFEGVSNTVSNVSSKGDSWETYSDSLSLREERLEGSLAISTTSFDSCLEQYQSLEKNREKNKEFRYNTRYRMMENHTKGNNEGVAGFPPKPNADRSRHLIMNSETKNSDNRIDDFMDREPQSQGIDCSDIPQNLQPLPRVSRTRGKKHAADVPPPNSYYLRSVREGLEFSRNLSSQNMNMGQIEGPMTRTIASTSRRLLEEELIKRRLSQNGAESIEPGRKSYADVNAKQDKQTHLLFQTPAKTVEESYSQTDEIFAPAHSTGSDATKNFAAGATANDSSEPTFQILHQRKSNMERGSSDDNQSSPQRKSSERKSEENKRSQNYWKNSGSSESRLAEDENSVESPDAMATEPLPSTQDTVLFQNSSQSERFTRLREAEDKESHFIFGPRNTSSRLGESCEFSFGLNWILSDEEDSDHGERFF